MAHLRPIAARLRVLALCLLPAAAARAQGAPVIQPLAYTRFTLANGLIVLVNEDHSAPLVATDIWYQVGSKDEGAGERGFAHLCEHLMSMGSPNVPGTELALVQSVGGTSSHWAQTFRDFTRYYQTVPSTELETVLWMESDRLAAPLATITTEKLAAARAVIGQERAADREARVFGFASDYTLTALYSDANPYSHDTLGPMDDLQRATIDDARRFCLPYYVPNNAILSISGDVTPATARRLAERYFGTIPRGAVPAHPAVPASALSMEARYLLEDARARQPVLRIAWPTVGFTSPDRVVLNALGSVLTADGAGRLSRALIDDRGLATSVVATIYDDEPLGGLFQIDVRPRAGASLTIIEQVVDSVLAALPAAPPTRRELERFSRASALMAVTQLQTREARANQLAQGMMWTGDPTAYVHQVELANRLTPADVVSAARRYLGAGRIVISMVPAGQRELMSKPTLPTTTLAPAASRPASVP